MFDPDEDFFKKKEWRVPVTSLLTGKISKWEKEDGEWVNERDIVCIIDPWTPIKSDELRKVRAPASGYLAIEKRFARPGSRVWGGLPELEKDLDIIAYIYTDPQI